MKKGIFTVFTFILMLCFLSCSNLLEEKEKESSEKVKVYFGLDNSRAIHSENQRNNWLYTLVGVYDGESTTFFEKQSYSYLREHGYEIQTGEWSFELTVYNGETLIFEDTKTVEIKTTGTIVVLQHRAVTSGTGSLSVKLSYPANKGVAKVTAKLYDDIPTADSGDELTINSNNCSATYTNNAVPSGVNKVLKFYLYDSQNVCIGSYIESVFIINGDYISVERSIANVNTFAATVYLTVNDEAWNDSGCALYAVKDGKKYVLYNTVGTNIFMASLPIGVYDIYNTTIDAAIDLEVDISGTSSAIVNYDYRFIFTTPDKIQNVVSSLSDTTKIIITGELNKEGLTDISQAVRNSEYDIYLDLSETEGFETIQYGLSTISGFSRYLIGLALPQGVTAIAGSSFRYCSNLKIIEIPKSVTSIGQYAFYGCSSLQSIVIPESVTTIGEYAFYGCSNIQNIEIPEGITDIGQCTFFGCSSLQNIEIPESVTSIGRNAFDGCSSLQSIEIPENVTSIARRAFNGCSSIQCIEIPASVSLGDGNPFTSCPNLTSISVDENNPYYVSEDGFLYNKRKDEIIASIDRESVIIPNTVKYISQSAFEGCTCLKSIEIPRSVWQMGGSVFYGCTSLEYLEIPNLVVLGSSAFAECTSLKSVVITNLDYGSYGITFGSGLFYGCTNLKSVVIRNHLSTIGERNFDGCTNLQIIELHNISYIYGNAFDGCTSLRTINYAGTESQWNSITKKDGWDKDIPSDMVINYNYQAE